MASTARLEHLYTDDKGELSISRLGLLLTIALAVITIGLDLALTLADAHASIPNTVYALETSMFMAFVSWVTGPRMASFIAPQISAAASAVAKATRDPRLPSKADDERDPA